MVITFENKTGVWYGTFREKRMDEMKLVSWNVNGLRAILGKDLEEQFKKFDADVFMLQETKLQAEQNSFFPEGYYAYYNYAEKKGYSGTGLLSKIEPLSVSYGIDIVEHDLEGRVITAEYEDFYMVCVYTPNSQNKLQRLDYRMQWENDFQTYIASLEKIKPVVIAGDLNVAHKEIDLKNPKTNRKNAGFTDEERSKMTQFLDLGYIDSFRHIHGDVEERYSWWSYRAAARDRNVGWRIDYFLVSDKLKEKIVDANIYDQEFGSDHAPVVLKLDL